MYPDDRKYILGLNAYMKTMMAIIMQIKRKSEDSRIGCGPGTKKGILLFNLLIF
jgi:hypothetical protein